MKPIRRKNNVSREISISCTKKIQKQSKSDPKFTDDETSLPMNSTKTIDWLPNDLIVDILAHVATISISDFFQSKDNDHYIYNKLSLDELSCHPWDLYMSKEATTLFTKCLNSQNSEAMYRLGVKKKSGVELLEKAANAGHLGASYFMGIILICKEEDESDDETKQSGIRHGIQLLGCIKTSAQMRECREKLKHIVQKLWLTQNHNFLIPKLFQCQFPNRKPNSWPLLDDYSHTLCCNTCRFNYEIVYVCNLVAGTSLFSCQTCQE
ncbi:uncharacterized protein LOC133033692 [Cannabis sativa]|uniref:uncharacterized protein LOC133033692 n=1 Tax=Cannabis sativa TaxID=3483 RepID=UPI0029CA8CC5|nr:uncharacterized protein LOC133033692 [Cannabis sativa]